MLVMSGTGHYVFGNTNSLLHTITGLGIEVSKVDAGSAAEIGRASCRERV